MRLESSFTYSGFRKEKQKITVTRRMDFAKTGLFTGREIKLDRRALRCKCHVFASCLAKVCIPASLAYRVLVHGRFAGSHEQAWMMCEGVIVGSVSA